MRDDVFQVKLLLLEPMYEIIVRKGSCVFEFELLFEFGVFQLQR
jgi:hypothetical protein